MSSHEKPYEGSQKRLVLGIDLGTTFSGVSYSLLDPGEVPRICSVTRYPGQEHASGSSKTPSVLYYDKNGKLQAAGAEALLSESTEKAEDEEWQKVEWFKVRLKPHAFPETLSLSSLPPLPREKTVIQIIADFFSYLLGCTEGFIRDTHSIDLMVWKELMRSAVFVLSHPNGWEGSQQSKLRRAAILGGLIPDSPEGRSRVKFVTEGEASLHHCLRGGFLQKASDAFIVADLGGGTLDFSAYKVITVDPLQLEEVCDVMCCLDGSTFVSLRAKGFFKDKLRGSRFGSDAHIDQLTERFDETLKKTFRSKTDVCLVPFGSATDKDIEFGIRSGKLKLSGEEVAALFKPSIVSAVSSIKKQIETSPVKIANIYLVGGFSANPYLVSQLRDCVSVTTGVEITTPDGQTAKTVAEGAISYYINSYVSSRLSRFAIGVIGSVLYDPRDPAHVTRSSSTVCRQDGTAILQGAFLVILRKGISLTPESEFRMKFSAEVANPEVLSLKSIALYAYRGPGEAPRWYDTTKVERSEIVPLCLISADLSTLRNHMTRRKNAGKEAFWEFHYELLLGFGGPEMTAQIVWFEKAYRGLYRSLAQVVYDDAFGDQDFPDKYYEAHDIPALVARDSEAVTEMLRRHGIAGDDELPPYTVSDHS